MTRVVVTSPADADTADIIAYLASEAGENVAARYVASFEAPYDLLSDHPHSGAPVLLSGRRFASAPSRLTS